MLLLDGEDSDGLLVRPRAGRLELGGDYAVGDQLRAASALAAGGVLACVEAERGGGAGVLPPELDLRVDRAVDRFGWYVDRRAGGDDLYSTGRGTRLRQVDGRETTAQAQLEQAWEVARPLVEWRSSGADVDAADRLVSGSAPLAVEAGRSREPAWAAEAPAAVESRLLHSVYRPEFVARVVTATWHYAVFEVRGQRVAYVSAPREQLGEFFERLGRGEFDELIGAHLRAAPSGLTLRSYDQAVGRPALWDAVDGVGLLAPPEPWGDGVFRLANGRTSKRMPRGRVSGGGGTLAPGTAGTSGGGGTSVAGPGTAVGGGPPGVSVATGDRPLKGPLEPPRDFISLLREWWKWLVGGLLVLLVALVSLISLGGDEEGDLVSVGGGGVSTVLPTAVVTVEPTATPTPVPLVVPDGYGDFVSLMRSGGVGDSQIGESLKLVVEDEMGPGTGIYSRSDTTPGNFGDDVDQWDVIPIRSPLGSAARMELVGNTVFECGVDTGEFLTLCSAGVRPLSFPEGDVVVIAEIMVEDVAAEAAQWVYQYALVADTDGSPANNYVPGAPWDWDLFRDTDTWWVLDRDAAGWSMDRFDASFGVPSPTAMRAVIRGNTILWLVPASEMPEGATFRTTSFRHDGSYAPGVSGADVIGGNPTEPLVEIRELDLGFFEDGVGSAAERTASATAVPTATATAEASAEATGEPTEVAVDGEALAREFVADFEMAQGTTDVEFLFGSLDELVVERYGAEQCRAYVALTAGSISEPTVNGVAGPRSFTYTTDGLETGVADIWSVDLSFLANGEPTSVEFNLHLVDGEIRWFTDCGEPAG